MPPENPVSESANALLLQDEGASSQIKGMRLHPGLRHDF
jgi:hypothetical protein